MEAGTHTFLDPPPTENEAGAGDQKSKSKSSATDKETKSFAFDHSYWSACPKDEPGYASQQTLYEDLGVDLLNNSFEGYNSCIFAYGQTGSGKSYSMMGYGQDRGIIPLTCSALFDRIQEKKVTDPAVCYTVEVSFMEIYNERVRDLLNPKNKGNLRVREHPSLGPYVEDLSKLAVQSYSDVETLMDEGNKARTVAATNMNETSSRSHSVFTLLLTQRRKDATTGMEGEKVSRISLVDLAGSERANSTGATGVRLKEGAQINKSLTTLGKVISALATAGSSGPGKKKKADDHVPYRDSVLTWLLKDSLGGNSKTAMIAAISPADYEETLSTLRYADQAKKIKNKAVVNEDPNAKLIRELKEELDTLRSRMSGGHSEDTYDVTLPPEKQIVKYQTKSGEIKTVTKAALQEQLEQSEKLMSEVAQTWEEKLKNTEVVQKEREQALEELGITIEKNNVGVYTPKRMPHLVNLNEDPLMSECLIYQIKPGTTTVGNTETTEPCDIRLSGRNILAQHCHFESDKETGAVELFSHPNAPTMVNGQRLSPGKPRKLRSGYRVILGDYHIFRFNHPEEVRKHREKVNTASEPGAELRSPLTNDHNGSASPLHRPDTPTSSSVIDPQDYHYARREAVISKLNGTEVNLDEMDEAEFEKLFDDVVRLRMQRKVGTSVSGRESRMSYISEEEDILSASHRPPSGSTFVTDDTSVAGSIFNDLELTIPEEGNQLKRSPSDLASNGAIETEHLRLEKEQVENQMKELKEEMEQKLEVQKQMFQKKVKKLRTKSMQFNHNDLDIAFELEDWTPQERHLARISIKRWKKLNRVKIAEKLLRKAVILKEANVISRELNKMVTYQFIIVDRSPLELTTSALESIKGLSEFDDVSDPELSDRSNRPCIGIKVLDKRHRSVYIWSLDKLETRVSQMRNLFNFIDKPEFSQHFNWEDPFYDPSPPLYSFIAHAFIPLGPIYRNTPIKTTLSLYSPYTLASIGTCRIQIRTIGIAPPARTGILLNSPNGTIQPTVNESLCPLVDDAKITLEIIIDEVVGLTSRDFSSVHCQFRASSITGVLKDGTEDHVWSSKAFDLPCDQKEMVLKQTISVVMSPQTKSHLAHGCAPIEFFGQLMPSYLDRLERQDEKKAEEKKLLDDNGGRSELLSPQSDSACPTLNQQSTASIIRMRQPETEFVVEQMHDVTSAIKMLELTALGDYQSTTIISQNALDPGVFYLRQGLQRKLAIRLTHNSGRQFGWQRMEKVEMGNVRLLDGQGRIHSSKVDRWVSIKASKKPVVHFEADGTSWMDYVGNWDAGGHESHYLDRVTQSEQRVLVELRWEVEAKNCVEPIKFRTDIGMVVKGRDQRVGEGILSLLRIERRLKQMNYLFSIKLKPMMISKVDELWRLSTVNQIVHGEERLKGWKTRGLGLLTEWINFRDSILLKTEVDGIKAIVTSLTLKSINELDERLRNPEPGAADLFKIGKSLELWQKRFGPKGNMKFLEEPQLIVLDQQPIESSSTPKQTFESPKNRRLKAEVRLIPRHENAIRKGKLNVLRDPTRDDWVNRWFVLKRPYLYIYEKNDEVEELGVINLLNVHIDSNPEMELMLNQGVRPVTNGGGFHIRAVGVQVG
ncbi:kinesin-like protein Klp8 [Puccinia graminis f. sp. tritici]|uniref:Kinesin-like protein Klp8 n=1 Tax=Puccinia graminis f. sp. tritici TaxID=56615 RepID=A0A5B0NNC7_PUCGR|nr:kinesin-like protein Klp8 [Puccinia graminis f. sp. tritici]KAA1090056.1 kinesin-like protein Klp8 [Puccinia graminis f. sp. tritici]